MQVGARMLLYEDKLRAAAAQHAATEEAIRLTQFIRTTRLHLWMDEREVGATDLQTACGRLAHTFAFVAPATPRPARSPPPAPGRRSADFLPTAEPTSPARK